MADMLHVLVGANGSLTPAAGNAGGGTLCLGFFWNGWWLWAALIFFLGRRSRRATGSDHGVGWKEKDPWFYCVGRSALALLSWHQKSGPTSFGYFYIYSKIELDAVGITFMQK